MSLHDWDLIDATTTFVGFDNYTELLADEYFWNARRQHVRHLPPVDHPAAAARAFLANLLNRTVLRARTFFRMAILMPNVSSVAAVAIVFGMLFQRDFGLINWLLSLVGVDPVDWHGAALELLDRHLLDGRLALDRLQRADPARRHAGDPEGPLRGGGDRRREPVAAVLADHPADAHARPSSSWSIISTIGGLQLFTEPLLFDNGNIVSAATSGSSRR